MSAATRIGKLEKRLGETAAPKGHTLEQLVVGSMGRPVGPPEKPVPPGAVSLEDLVAYAEPIPGKVD